MVANIVSDKAGKILLLYDGECPFCSRYVRLLRLREAVGAIQFVDAREGGPAVEAAQREGYDLNEGMLLQMHGKYYHSADCIQVLSLLTTKRTAFNRLNALLFGKPSIARLIYPILRAGRNMTLTLLGRSEITTDG